MNGRLLRKIGLSVLARTRYPPAIQFLLNHSPVDTTVSIDDSAQIERGCRMIGDITVGERARIGERSHLEGNVKIGTGTNLVRDDEVIGDVSIGNYCAIARDTTVQGRDHVTKWPAMQMRFYKRELGTELPHTSKGPVEIGSDVWIGTGVTILSGVSIGHGAIIGAGAIVTKDVEPYSVVAGVPATRVGWRFPSHVRKQLLDIAWWNWDEEKIKQNIDFFTTDVSTVDSVSDYLA